MYLHGIIHGLQWPHLYEQNVNKSCSLSEVVQRAACFSHAFTQMLKVVRVT